MTAEESKKTYNGWTNYETWCVNLWMDNDEGSREHYHGLAQDCWEAAESSECFTREQQASLDLAGCLKEEFEESRDEFLQAWTGAPGSVWMDLLGAALSEVNWHEIAGHYIAEVDKIGEAE